MRPDRHLRSTAAALGAALLVSCGGDATTPIAPLVLTRANVSGTYTARTVDGQPLPAVLGGASSQWYTGVADTLALAADGTYTETQVVTYAAPTAGVKGITTTDRFSGTWSLSGTTLTRNSPLRGGLSATGAAGSDETFQILTASDKYQLSAVRQGFITPYTVVFARD